MKTQFLILGALLLMVTDLATALSQENLIVRENRKEGTTNWLLFNYNQVVPGRDDLWKREKGIEGYCSHASIKAGETLKVFVSTEPAASFKIDFYRMGYYGGKGGRLMRSTGALPGQPQPTPEDGKKMLIECNWNVSHELKIPQDWPSGVYLGKLQVATPKAEAYVIFIVRDERKADLLFQCSDMTWQSYNRWPAWRSLYDYQDNKWHTSVGNDVGFDRPYGIALNWLPVNYFPISNGSGEFLLWEFPLAFWLEKEGYDVSYISNIDTHADRDGLLRARGWLSVGHDEYWSQQMYDNVAYARDQGVSLAFLSGNSVSGLVYLNPSTDGRPNRVFGRIRRFGQAARDLMGSSSHGTGMADWTVEEPGHWIFDGTGMKKGDGISKLVGWEYHGAPNGNQPGLTILATAPTRPRDNRDLNPRNPHTSTIYELPGGNIVFDAGTCWWNMVLSTPPGEMNPPRRDFSKDDPRVQRITANLLKRMIQSAPITLDSRKQLFLDDYLIASMTRVKRSVEQAGKFAGNPVLWPTERWEPSKAIVYGSVIRDGGKFKMWYLSGLGVGYAESDDGIQWSKPRLDLTLVEGERSNILFARKSITEAPDAFPYFHELFGVHRDDREPDPERRFKMGFLDIDWKYDGPDGLPWRKNQRRGLGVAGSPDGLHWKLIESWATSAIVDGATHWMFDPARGKYVLYGRTLKARPEVVAAWQTNDWFKQWFSGRAVARVETTDFLNWDFTKPETAPVVMTADLQDKPGTEIYSMKVFPYEGLYIGLVQVFHATPAESTLDVQLAVSRDTIHFTRVGDRSPFLALGPIGSWDRFNLSLANNDPIVTGDELRIYYSGRLYRHGPYAGPDLGVEKSGIGFATLQRDRFVALEASFDGGEIVTKPVNLKGTTLHLNAKSDFGEIIVELLDANDQPLAQSKPMQRDSLDFTVDWTGEIEQPSEPVTLRIKLKNARLFALWCSQ